MSDIGYRNKNQATVSVSVNSLERLRARSVQGHRHALPALRKARRQGRRQVSAAQRQHPADRERVLQLHPAEARRELRRAADQGACAARASSTSKCARSMSARSIRSGVNQNKLRFLEAFLALCVLSRQRAHRPRRAGGARRQPPAGGAPRPRAGPHAQPGRARGADARVGARTARLHARHCARCWITARPTRPYQTALEQQRAKIDDVERTPSARLLTEMRQTGESFFQLAQRMSKMHKDYFLDLYPPNERRLARVRGRGARIARGAGAHRGGRQDAISTPISRTISRIECRPRRHHG